MSQLLKCFPHFEEVSPRGAVCWVCKLCTSPIYTIHADCKKISKLKLINCSCSGILNPCRKYLCCILEVCWKQGWITQVNTTFLFFVCLFGAALSKGEQGWYSVLPAQAQFEDPSFTHFPFQTNPAGKIPPHKHQGEISDIKKIAGNLTAAMITYFFMEASLAVESNTSLYIYIYFNNEILIDSTIIILCAQEMPHFLFIRWKQQPENTDWWKISMELARSTFSLSTTTRRLVWPSSSTTIFVSINIFL